MGYPVSEIREEMTLSNSAFRSARINILLLLTFDFDSRRSVEDGSGENLWDTNEATNKMKAMKLTTSNIYSVVIKD